jgi:hypothetical protein
MFSVQVTFPLTFARLAANAGFDLIVTDDRTSYATKERFPTAREVHALDFDEAVGSLTPTRLPISSSLREGIATICAYCAGRCRLGPAT